MLGRYTNGPLESAWVLWAFFNHYSSGNFFFLSRVASQGRNPLEIVGLSFFLLFHYCKHIKASLECSYPRFSLDYWAEMTTKVAFYFSLSNTS